MAMNLKKDIKPITDFRNNAKDILEQAHSTKRPIVITQHGKSAAVLIDIEEYQRIKDRLELLEAIARSKTDFENGKFVNHDQAMKALDKCLKE